MYQLLIVDDEPLVQAGIRSMLNWNEMNIDICGTAMNGQAALKIIEEKSPDIVITDIKMPVMSGLELAKVCRERYGENNPYFIILTSYEDFQMARDALSYQVSDYLVKLELTPEVLKNAIDRVIIQISQSRKKQMSAVNIHPFYDKFLISLLHDLFESEEQFRLQSRDLNLNFEYSSYVCCYGEIISPQADQLSAQKQIPLFTSSLQMIRELGAKYLPLYALSLDLRHFALIFCFADAADTEDYVESLTDILQSISSTLQNYYNVTLRCGIGTPVRHPVRSVIPTSMRDKLSKIPMPILPLPLLIWIIPKRMPGNPLISACSKTISPGLLRNTIPIFCEPQSSLSAAYSGIIRDITFRHWMPPVIFCICLFPCCRTENPSSPASSLTIRTDTAPCTSSPMLST